MTASALQRAIELISQSDPVVKLLDQVRLGRMKAGDPGLRAVTEAWLATYKRVIETAEGIDPAELPRLNPRPRLEVLTGAGVLTETHPGIQALLAAFDRRLAHPR